MTLTESARQHLERMLERSGTGVRGFRLEGVLGSCHVSVPLLKPAAGPVGGEMQVTTAGIDFYVPKHLRSMSEEATLDYDHTFLQRGLKIRWPHGLAGCPACSGHTPH
ncbi:MAG: hypothetical protein KAI66_03515 [Lentisphaeria bacterium]|nr:hypothetical protein [Lentisphaeria bacterium]